MRFGFFVTSFIADTNQSGTLIIVDTNTSKIEIISSVKLSESLLAQHRLGFLKCVAPDVLNDCVRKRMFNCFGPSKLMRVYVPVNAAHYESFCYWIDLFENDGLPIYRIFTWRQAINRLTRWRELIDYFIFMYMIRILKLPLYRLWSRI